MKRQWFVQSCWHCSSGFPWAFLHTCAWAASRLPFCCEAPAMGESLSGIGHSLHHTTIGFEQLMGIILSARLTLNADTKQSKRPGCQIWGYRGVRSNMFQVVILRLDDKSWTWADSHQSPAEVSLYTLIQRHVCWRLRRGRSSVLHTRQQYRAICFV